MSLKQSILIHEFFSLEPQLECPLICTGTWFKASVFTFKSKKLIPYSPLTYCYIPVWSPHNWLDWANNIFAIIASGFAYSNLLQLSFNWSKKPFCYSVCINVDKVAICFKTKNRNLLKFKLPKSYQGANQRIEWESTRAWGCGLKWVGIRCCCNSRCFYYSHRTR